MFKYVVPLILDGLRSRLILVGFVVICLQYLSTFWLTRVSPDLSGERSWVCSKNSSIQLSAVWGTRTDDSAHCSRHGIHQVLEWESRFWEFGKDVFFQQRRKPRQWKSSSTCLCLAGIGAIWCCAAGKGHSVDTNDGSSFRDWGPTPSHTFQWVTVSHSESQSQSHDFGFHMVPWRSCKSLRPSCGTWRSSSRVVRIRRMLRGIQQAWRE
jgi:hypothetical protein